MTTTQTKTTVTTLRFEDCYPGQLVRVANNAEELKVRRVGSYVTVANMAGGRLELSPSDFQAGLVTEETH